MNKIEILKNTYIGSRVAEQELEGLKNYFLKTYLWEQLINDQVDIVFGCKGSGKSAIYNYLSTYEYDLISKYVYLTLAENPRGTVAFKDLNTSPPTDEFEFKCIWKLCFVLIISQKLSEENFKDEDFKTVIEKLQQSDLIARRATFTSTVKMVRDYIRRINPVIEPNVSLNENSGLIEKIGVKISLLEPSNKSSDKGIVSVDNLFELLNKSLKNNSAKIWLAIDRLDAVFQEDFELEATALRTLFQVYNDLQTFSNIRLIIFLRDDIWSRIIENGFRETSHITKTESIKWDHRSLYDLLMTRIEKNTEMLHYLKIDTSLIPSNRDELFRCMFPKKQANKTDFTFEWIISKIEDGNENASPRELIQLVSSAIKNEIKLISEGISSLDFISFESLLVGFKDVSKTKIETFVAEYPKLKTFIFRLKGQKKVRFKLDELKEIWECSKKDTIIISNNLIKLGFFKNESNVESTPILFIPLVFRPSLNLQY